MALCHWAISTGTRPSRVRIGPAHLGLSANETEIGHLQSPFPCRASLVKSRRPAVSQRGRCCRGGCRVHEGPMGGGWEGRGSPKRAPNGDGLGRMKMTGGGADGWSPAVEMESRQGETRWLGGEAEGVSEAIGDGELLAVVDGGGVSISCRQCSRRPRLERNDGCRG
jgi:hypothetical protein